MLAALAIKKPTLGTQCSSFRGIFTFCLIRINNSPATVELEYSNLDARLFLDPGEIRGPI